MGIRELRAVYGPNAKARSAINAAIRQELPGGSAVLDALNCADLAVTNQLVTPQRLLDLLLAAKAELADEIARRYELRSAG